MKLVDEWRYLAPRLWSIRLAIVAAGFGALEAILPYFTDFIRPGVFAVLSALTAIGSAVTRLVQQTQLHETPEK